MKQKGYIQVYTGNGKGKTTAALGLALRAAGRGRATYFAQFMKKGDYGEMMAADQYLSRWIQIEQFGLPDFHYGEQPVTQQEYEAAQAGLAAVDRAMKSGRFDIVVMDEVNVALHFKILAVSEVLAVLNERPGQVEIVLTGRYAPDEIIQKADLVTEMKEIKHYYTLGITARTGIEK